MGRKKGSSRDHLRRADQLEVRRKELVPGVYQEPDSFGVDAWRLDPPMVEYSADAVAFLVRNGRPEMVFGQTMPDGKLLSALSITLEPTRFPDMVRSFHSVIVQIPGYLEKWPGIDPSLIEDFDGLNSGNYRKYHASIVRGGAGEHFAMIDFYKFPLIVEKNVEYMRNNPQKIVEPVFRVRLTPVCFKGLFDRVFEEFPELVPEMESAPEGQEGDA